MVRLVIFIPSMGCNAPAVAFLLSAEVPFDSRLPIYVIARVLSSQPSVASLSRTTDAEPASTSIKTCLSRSWTRLKARMMTCSFVSVTQATSPITRSSAGNASIGTMLAESDPTSIRCTVTVGFVSPTFGYRISRSIGYDGASGSGLL